MGNTVTQEQRDEYLSIAAEKGEAQTVDKWLKKGANPNTGLDDGDRKKRTSLHRAAKTKNNVDVLTKLLSCIKDVGEYFNSQRDRSKKIKLSWKNKRLREKKKNGLNRAKEKSKVFLQQ